MNKHSECENFCAIDVAKGICRISGELVLIDTTVCGEFEALAKCGACRHFAQPDADGLGRCSGLGREYWTAAANRAVTCEGYAERE